MTAGRIDPSANLSKTAEDLYAYIVDAKNQDELKKALKKANEDFAYSKLTYAEWLFGANKTDAPSLTDEVPVSEEINRLLNEEMAEKSLNTILLRSLIKNLAGYNSINLNLEQVKIIREHLLLCQVRGNKELTQSAIQTGLMTMKMYMQDKKNKEGQHDELKKVVNQNKVTATLEKFSNPVADQTSTEIQYDKIREQRADELAKVKKIREENKDPQSTEALEALFSKRNAPHPMWRKPVQKNNEGAEENKNDASITPPVRKRSMS